MKNTLHKKLEEIATQFPERIAVQMKREDGYQTYTYKEFYNTSRAIARFLISFDIKRGDKIAIVLENRPEWGMVYFAILFAGGIAVPIDPQSNPEEIRFILTESKSKIVFTSSAHLSSFETATSLKKIVSIDSPDFPKIISASPLSEPLSEAKLRTESSCQDLASILYTSGTTGKPKGVMLSHKNFLANFQSIDKLKLVSERDNILSILPLHHAYPFMVTLLVPLFSRARITYIPTFKSDELLKCMQESGVTILVGVPQLFSIFYRNITTKIKEIPSLMRLFARKFISAKIRRNFGKNLRFFVCGGAKLDSQVTRFLAKIGFTILEGYGLTETSPVVTFNPLKKQKIGSVGKVIPDVQLKIAQPDEKGIGEVLIKGANVMAGYYKREEETKSVLKNDWFYSGDLGYLDKQGYLYLTGRKKELIVLSSGKNISPEEVEAHYARSPFVKEVCVLAVGERGEERLSAVVVPDLDYCRRIGGVNIYDRIKWDLENLSTQLPAYKRIMGFIVVQEDLPRTRLGKIKRFAVKEKYEKELRGGQSEKEKTTTPPADTDRKMLSSEPAKGIIKVLNKITKREVGLDEHLELDLGIDSLGRVELIAGLEKVLKINLPDSLMGDVFTVRELILQVEKLLLEKGASTSISTPGVEIRSELWKEILEDHPSKETIEKISLSPNWIARSFTLISSGILYLIFKIFWRLKILGRENIPKKHRFIPPHFSQEAQPKQKRAGGFIFCANHGSFLDGPLILASLPVRLKKSLYILGLRAYFEVPLIRNLLPLLKVIPIDPTLQLVDAMQACAYIIKNGKLLCIFPEGTRSPDGGVKEFKKGIGILAGELNLELVPVYISGSYESWPRTKRLPKPHPIKIIFGKPHTPKELKKQGWNLGAKDDYEAIALGIREEVIKLKEMG
ncbi:MAG: AMP-binding protein [Candidatus Omnitrophica bacterium]|nr:AMP-binding protein [Candidatus Omnitrophota bacterium]